MSTSVPSFHQRADDDGPINICGAKYSDRPYTVTKAYATAIQRKMDVFQQRTDTKKQLFFTLLTVGGVTENVYRLNLVDQVVDLDGLFSI